jgi:ribosomal protein L32
MFYDYGGVSKSFGSMEAANEASRASETARTADEHVKQVEKRLERLLMVTQAMWDLLGQKTGLDEQVLLDQVQLRAQRRTEELSAPSAFKCPKCGRTMGANRNKCMYCGAERPIDSVFQAV